MVRASARLGVRCHKQPSVSVLEVVRALPSAARPSRACCYEDSDFVSRWAVFSQLWHWIFRRFQNSVALNKTDPKYWGSYFKDTHRKGSHLMEAAILSMACSLSCGTGDNLISMFADMSGGTSEHFLPP